MDRRSVLCLLVGFHKTGSTALSHLLHSSPSERTPPPVAIIELLQQRFMVRVSLAHRRKNGHTLGITTARMKRTSKYWMKQ
jgi:hypothetical protein